jgi:RHS repeat-associated protein
MSSTSGQATLRNHLEYNAFGAITSQTNATYQPLQTFTGQILDPTTGLLFYDARWYDPKLGRFVCEDPIGFAAGDANPFRYVGNSWPNGTDPTGLDADRNGVPSPEAQVRQLREWLSFARENGITVTYVELEVYTARDGTRYERTQVKGLRNSWGYWNPRQFDGPTCYRRISWKADSQLDSMIFRNGDGDVMAVPRPTAEALANATAPGLIYGERAGNAAAVVVVIFVPSLDDIVISGLLGTTVIRRLTAAGFEVVEEAVGGVTRIVLRKVGKELAEESAEEARKIVAEAVESCGATISPSKGVRPHSSLVDDFHCNPGDWERIWTGGAPGEGRRTQGGVSLESKWLNKKTGETLSTHEAFDKGGKEIHRGTRQSPNLPDGGSVRPGNRGKEQ